MDLQSIVQVVIRDRAGFLRRNLRPGIVVVGLDVWGYLRTQLDSAEYHCHGRRCYIMGIRCVSSRDVPDDFIGVFGDVP